MTKFVAHRCQLFQPSICSIQAIAFEENLQKLAIARSDGRIELWDTKHYFTRQMIFPPASSSSIESLVWCKGRLHSCGFDGFLRIYSVHKTFPIFEVKVSASAVWCCVKSPTNTHLAVGTEDGTLLLLHVDNDSGAQYDKTLVRTDKRILCLSWHEDGMTIAGGSLDVIRLWNVETGRCLQRISIPRNRGNTETVVWSILLLKDMTLVSGDSRGRTSFWNGRNGTLINSYESHKADVLSVVYDKASGVFYSSGIEPVICQYACVEQKVRSTLGEDDSPLDIHPAKRPKTDADCRKNFVEGARLGHVHTHDVRCMLFVNDWLITGGVDTFLALSKYPPNVVQRIAPFDSDKIQIVPCGKEVLFTYEDRCEIWRLGGTMDQPGYTNRELLSLDKEPTKLVEIKAKENSWISCSAISSTGSYLAYSNGHDTTIYKMEFTNDMNQVTNAKPVVNRVKCLTGSVVGATSLAFCFYANSDRFVVASSSSFSCYVLNDLFSKFENEMNFLGDFIVRKMFPFRNGRFCVAFFTSQDDVVLADFETNKIISKLPRTIATPVDLCFSSPESDDFFVLYSDGSLVEYSTTLCKYTNFSRNVLCKFPNACPFKSPPLGISLLKVDSDISIFVYGSSELYLLKHSETDNKRREDCKLWSKRNDSYQYLCKFGCLSNGDVFAVEILNSEYAKLLPPVLNVRKFGTG